MLITDLINRLPESTKERVVETKKNFNKLIRDAIRFELRLSLNSGQEHTEDDEQSVYTKVTVNVEAGYPIEIQDFQIPDQYQIASILSQIRPVLISLRDSAKTTSDFLYNHQNIHEISNFLGGAIFETVAEATDLIKIVDAYDLAKEILKINNDILGCYRMNSDSRRYPYSINGEIFLYWGIIGLVSTQLGVEVEALTAVVLAHELSHAYTHLGFDIDGNRWDNELFSWSETSVKEGLAQYYTERIIGRLRYKIPGSWDAYQKLLEKQNENYHTHKMWMNKINPTPESVRSTLIQLRNEKPMTLDDFNDALFQNTKRKKR